MEWIEAVKKGLNYQYLDDVSALLQVSQADLANTINIAPRTLARRKGEHKLYPDESDRLLRISRLFERAVDVLGGPDNAREWLKSPRKALGGKTPLEFADTEVGAREVEDLLGRIEHGVFS